MSAVFDSRAAALAPAAGFAGRPRPPSRSRSAAPSRARAATERRHPAVSAPRLPWLVLGAVLVLELVAACFPAALLLHPAQSSVLFKQISGYTMLTLLTFAIAFGGLRRLPSLAKRQRELNRLHQIAGLALLLLLASHVGASPKGFLLYVFHALAFGMAAGSLRAVFGARVGARGAATLLVLHIGLACLVGAGALAHLYFIYVYTA